MACNSIVDILKNYALQSGCATLLSATKANAPNDYSTTAATRRTDGNRDGPSPLEALGWPRIQFGLR